MMTRLAHIMPASRRGHWPAQSHRRRRRRVTVAARRRAPPRFRPGHPDLPPTWSTDADDRSEASRSCW